LIQRARTIRDDKVQVDADGAAEPPAGVAGADGTVEREQIRKRRAVGRLAERALQAAAEGMPAVRRRPYLQAPAAEAKRHFDGIEHALFSGRLENQAIGHHRDFVFALSRRPFV